MTLQAYPIDPLHVCHCGRAPNELVPTENGRYVETKDVLAVIAEMRAELEKLLKEKCA